VTKIKNTLDRLRAVSEVEGIDDNPEEAGKRDAEFATTREDIETAVSNGTVTAVSQLVPRALYHNGRSYGDDMGVLRNSVLRAGVSELAKSGNADAQAAEAAIKEVLAVEAAIQ